MPADHDADYPIEEHMAFQRREWRAERIGWVLLILIALAALSGLLAYGPLSRANATDASHRLSVAYDRFERITVTTRMALHVAAPKAPFAIRLAPDFATNFEIDSIAPMPMRSTQGPGGLTLSFAPPPAGDFTAVVWYRPRRIGFVDVSVALDAGPPLRRTILIYP